MADRVGSVDLAEQYAELGAEIEEKTLAVLRSGRHILGPDVDRFEKEWAQFCGVGHAIGVGNGTDALYLALRASGIESGDRVVLPSYTFIATYESVVRCGAVPLLADVDPLTGCIAPESVRQIATEAGGAKAVLGVHLYGFPCDVQALRAALAPWDGFLVEDAAQAHGAILHDIKAGGLGRAAAFSFYPTKNLSAAGDGGAVTTPHDDIAERVRVLRDHGRTDRYYHGELGTNSRLDSVQAAILRIKLKRLEAWTQQRRQVAQWWTEALSPLAQSGKLRLPSAPADSQPSWHLFPIRVSENKDAARGALQQAEVDFGEHYPVAIHDQPAVQARLDAPVSLPESEAWAREVITLPCHPHVSQQGIERASDSLQKSL